MLNNIKNLKVKFWQNFGKFLLFLPPPKTTKPQKWQNLVFRFGGYSRYPKNEITQVPKISKNRKNQKKEQKAQIFTQTPKNLARNNQTERPHPEILAKTTEGI